MGLYGPQDSIKASFNCVLGMIDNIFLCDIGALVTSLMSLPIRVDVIDFHR